MSDTSATTEKSQGKVEHFSYNSTWACMAQVTPLTSLHLCLCSLPGPHNPDTVEINSVPAQLAAALTIAGTTGAATGPVSWWPHWWLCWRRDKSCAPRMPACGKASEQEPFSPITVDEVLRGTGLDFLVEHRNPPLPAKPAHPMPRALLLSVNIQ